MQPAARLEVRSASGNLLFVVTVSETENNPSVTSTGTPAPVSHANVDGNNGHAKPQIGPRIVSQKEITRSDSHPQRTPQNGEALMTDSQKRLLFRLMADQGIEGDKAHERLKKEFQVNSLKEVTKLDASHAIEKFLDNAKGGRPSHAAT